MIEKRNEVIIRGSADEVWETLTNFTHYSQWNPLIYQVEGKLEIGEEVIISVNKRGEEKKFTCKIASLEVPRKFSWKFHMGIPFFYRGEHTFQVETIDSRTVRFIDRETFQGLLAPLLVKDPKSTVAAGMIVMGKALKKRIEVN